MSLKWIRLAAIAASVCLASCQGVTPKNTETPVKTSKPATQDLAQNTMNTTDFNLPEIPPAKLFQHVTPEMFQLNNGMNVWYVRNPMVPLMNFKVLFSQGASEDPFDKSGRTAFAAAMLKEGANGKTAQQISDDIEFIGASLSPSIKQDSAAINMQVMTQFFDRALDILADIWLKPDFTQESYERLQKIILNGLKQREDVPNAIAKLASNSEYFGEEHPYAHSTDGYLDTIPNITIEDIKAAYQEVFNPSAAAIIAVGDLETDNFKQILNEKFGNIKIDASTVRVPKDYPMPVPTQRLTIVDKPNAPQTVIRIYQPAIPATSLETLPWQFVNIPFGGSFTSRLMQNIREDKGFSYGANSIVVPEKRVGIFLSTSAVATEVTGPALQEFINELERLPKGDFTQEEFDRARETWKSELVQSFETQAGIIATIAGLYANQKPIDAINAFARKIDSLTLEDFNNFARKFPTLSQATITLVGDKDKILEQIKDLPLPPPTFRNAEGKLIK